MLLAEGIGDTIRVSLTGDPVEEVRVALEILRTLELAPRGPRVISCPTCGRTRIDLEPLALEVERRLEESGMDLEVAVMGCVVNGPGEARKADFGIAGGEGEGVVFAAGKPVRKVPQEGLVDALFAEIAARRPGAGHGARTTAPRTAAAVRTAGPARLSAPRAGFAPRARLTRAFEEEPMRATALFMPTVKEDPADAEAISHKLMVRGGFVRQFASGIYIMLPLGWRVMQRICRVIREEMDAIGGLELSMPTLHPADVWQATGRYDAIGQEMFRLKDRGGRDMVLAMTHEEVFAWLASRELRSYRDLPQIWYQLQLKFRDEPRPKGGVLRVREFLMKDSYSFDADEAGLEVSYEKHIGAYDRIFSRCGIEFYRVESDSGFMGGAQAHEYMAPSPAGEDHVALCEACGYAANVELARSVARDAREDSDRRRVSERRPSARRLARWRRPTSAPSKRCRPSWPSRRLRSSRAWSTCAGGQPVMALVRGDHSLHENKLARYLKAEVRPAHPEEVKDATGAEVGFVGPVGLPESRPLRVVADESLRPGGSAARASTRRAPTKPTLTSWASWWGVTSSRSTPICARPRRATVARNAADRWS